MKLANHFLINISDIDTAFFKDTVIYICEHNESGAMGVMINQATDVMLSDLFKRIDLKIPENFIQNGEDFNKIPVLNGGPVQQDRGFVLHEPPSNYTASIIVNGNYPCRVLTTSRDILESLSEGKGPSRIMITLGYSAWAAGQLETEIAQNAWLTVPANDQADSILWDIPLSERKQAVVRLLGIDPNVLINQTGHA